MGRQLPAIVRHLGSLGLAVAVAASWTPARAQGAPSAVDQAMEEQSSDYMIENRRRLDGIQMRVRAQRALLEWTRQQTLKTMEQKYTAEQERLREAFDTLVKEMRAENRERHRHLIAELESYVLKYAQTQASGDLYLRLAELYFDEANYDFIEAMEQYEKDIDAYYEGKSNREPEMPAPDYGKAVELYEEFVQAYPTHRYIREALYLYAFTLEESVQGFDDEAAEKRAIEIYKRLLKLDPDGPLAPEVAFRIGEYYFLGAYRSEWEEAADFYRHALKLKDDAIYDKALYKLAWTYYRLGDFERALLGFVEMVDYSTKSEVTATDMRDESLQYIAIVFSERGGLDAMQAFFDKIGGRDYENEAMARLGKLYFDTADHQAALEVFEELLERKPMSREAPELVRSIQEAWLKMEKEEKVVEQWQRFADTFGPGSVWARNWQREDRGFADDVSAEAEKKRFDYALFIHAEGQQAQSAAQRQGYYKAALKAYEVFEKQFPTSHKLADAVFNRAEIHYELKNWEVAGGLYQRVPQLLVDTTSEMFADSAWNMILSYRQWLGDYEKTPAGQQRLQAEAADRRAREKAAEQKQREGGTGMAEQAAASATAVSGGPGAAKAPHEQRAGAATTPAEAKPAAPAKPAPPAAQASARKTLPREAIELIKASLYYVRLYPLGEKSPAVYYNTGDIFFAYGLYDRARDQYLSFVQRFPDNQFLMDGIKQVTRTYLIEEKFAELVAWGYAIIDSTLWNREDVRDYFTTILSGAIFKDAQQLEAQGQRIKAAETYLEMVRRFPASEFVDEALINAAVSYQKQGLWDESTDIFLRFYQTYPEHEFASQALFQTAWNSERVLDFPEAVSRYIELLDAFPKDKRTKDALFNAATILAKLGQDRRAAELYLLYIKRFPGEEDEADNLFFAAKAYYNDGDYETAQIVFERFNKHPDRNEREVEATYILAQIAKNEGDEANYLKLLEKVIDLHTKYASSDTPVDPVYAGEASFRLAEQVDQAYRNIKLRLPMQVMASLLEKKAADLKKVEDAYSKVVTFKDPLWSSAALHRIGAAYQHFADTLFDAPVPPELDEEEAEFYVMELEDQAFPIEDKAMQYWQRNLDLAVKLGIHNEWVQQSRDQLVKLFPDVAQVKEEESWQEAHNEFYYVFPPSTAKDADVRIDGAKVIYGETDYRIENLEERYAITRTWSHRQRKVVLSFDLKEPILLHSGQPIDIEGIKELWRKRF